jgi:hypothetical protein
MQLANNPYFDPKVFKPLKLYVNSAFFAINNVLLTQKTQSSSQRNEKEIYFRLELSDVFP